MKKLVRLMIFVTFTLGSVYSTAATRDSNASFKISVHTPVTVAPMPTCNPGDPLCSPIAVAPMPTCNPGDPFCEIGNV